MVFLKKPNGLNHYGLNHGLKHSLSQTTLQNTGKNYPQSERVELRELKK
jgi:hypothetical protein